MPKTSLIRHIHRKLTGIVLDTRTSCARTVQPIEMLLGGGLTHVGPMMGSRSDESICSREGWHDGDLGSSTWVSL